MTDPTWVTVAQAIHYTGRSERTIRRILAEHQVEERQDGRRILLSLTDLRRAQQLRKPGRRGTGRDDKGHAGTEEHR